MPAAHVLTAQSAVQAAAQAAPSQEHAVLGVGDALGAYVYLYTLLVLVLLALVRSLLLRRRMDARNKELTETNERLTREIEARRLAQAQLARSRDALDRSQRLAGLGSWRHVAGHSHAWWSDHMYRLFGYEPGTVTPDRAFFDNHVHDDDRTTVATTMLQIRPDEEFDLRIRFTRRDGQWRTGRLMGRAGTDEEGRTAVSGTFQDISEALAAQQTLATSEKRLRLALEAANEGLWEWNTATGEVFFSPSWYTMLGYEPDEFPPSFEVWHGLVHPEDRERTEAVIRSARVSGRPYAVEYRMRAKDGSWRWTLSRGRATAVDAGGSPLGIHGTTCDITAHKESELALRRASEDVERLVDQRTEELRQANQRMGREIDERRKAEDALRDSEALLRQLISNIDQAFWMRDLDSGRYVFVSPACEAMVGQTLYPSEDESFLFMDFVHPLDRLRVSESLMRSQNNAYASLRTEFRILRADGAVRWISAGIFPVLDAQGRPHRLAGTATDITRRKSVETSLESSQQRLRTIFNSVNEGIFIHDVTGQIIDVNERVLEMYGVTKEEAMGMSFEGDFSGPDEPVEVLAERWSRVLAGESQSFLWQARRPRDEAIFPVEVYLCKVRLALRDAILACVTDVTMRQRAEAEVRTLSMAVEQSPVSVFITDPHGVITYANPKTLSILGYQRHELVGSDPRILRSQRQDDETFQDMWRTILDGRDWSGDIRNRTADGREIWQSASVSPITDEAGRIVNFVAVMEDITDKKEREDHMRHLALHDTLTGLPNRILFMDRLAQGIERVQRSSSRLAVMYIDLDGFKPVNDTLGHDTGDQVLLEVARRFQDTVRKVDTVARIGGDEFVVLLQDVQDMQDMQDPQEEGREAGGRDDLDIAAQRILDCFVTPLQSAPDFQLGASIGISICPRHGYNPDILIQRADQAMYQAKQAGRHTFRYAE